MRTNSHCDYSLKLTWADPSFLDTQKSVRASQHLQRSIDPLNVPRPLHTTQQLHIPTGENDRINFSALLVHENQLQPTTHSKPPHHTLSASASPANLKFKAFKPKNHPTDRRKKEQSRAHRTQSELWQDFFGPADDAFVDPITADPTNLMAIDMCMPYCSLKDPSNSADAPQSSCFKSEDLGKYADLALSYQSDVAHSLDDFKSNHQDNIIGSSHHQNLAPDDGTPNMESNIYGVIDYQNYASVASSHDNVKNVSGHGIIGISAHGNSDRHVSGHHNNVPTARGRHVSEISTQETHENAPFLTANNIDYIDESAFAQIFDDAPELPPYCSLAPSILPPLPPILQNVPYYRNLMHFWMNVVAPNLIPTPTHLYNENPFMFIVPQIAVSCPSAMAALLAFAGEIKRRITRKLFGTSLVVEQLTVRACDELNQLLQDPATATADQTLASVLILSLFELFRSRNFDRHRSHNIDARRIILAKSRKGELALGPGNASRKVASFLVRLFVYVDVIGALSATRDQEKYLAGGGLYGQCQEREHVSNSQQGFLLEALHNERGEIDELCGFEVNLFPNFIKIALLARKAEAHANHCRSHGIEVCMPPEITREALDARESLLRAYEKGEARRREALEHNIRSSTRGNDFLKLLEQDKLLRTTNKMYCDMGLISLYRRVLQVPRESDIIQDLANGVGQLAKQAIEPKLPTDICTLFPLFTAGCETTSEEMRRFFSARFNNLIEMGNVNAQEGLRIMTHSWETGLNWIDAARDLDIDLTLL